MRGTREGALLPVRECVALDHSDSLLEQVAYRDMHGGEKCLRGILGRVGHLLALPHAQRGEFKNRNR